MRIRSEEKDKKIKIIIIITLVSIALLLTYYFHSSRQSSILFTHFFYIPIILTSIWWERKGLLVSFLLGGNLLISDYIIRGYTLVSQDISRVIMFLIIPLLVIELRKEIEIAEEEIKIAYEKINQIFNITGSGLRVIDKHFNMIHFNDGFLSLLGIKKEDVVGKKCYEVLRGPLCHTSGCTLRQILRGREHVESDIEKELSDGTKRYCILSAIPLRRPDGSLIGIVEDLKDITDRMLAQKALRESEERYRSFVKNFKGIAFQSSIDFSPIFFHGAVETITGYTEEEFITGKPRWDEIIHHNDLPKIYETSKRLRRIPNFSCEREYCIVRKDGEMRWVEEIIHNTCDHFGRPILIQGIIYDITDRKGAEEALIKSEERFLQAQKMEAIGRLAGGVAHDFNNLLTIIMGNSGLVLDDLKENNQLRSDIMEIYKAGNRATLLTRQLLAFSRKQMLKPKVLDLNTIVSDTEKMLRRLIGEDINLITTLGPDLALTKADPGQIEQIIMNLAVNARDAMPQGGDFTIKTRNVILDEDYCKIVPEGRAGRFVMLSFEDTGIGMDKTILNRIFDPFFSTKGPGEGTGLGLSTVYGIVKQHEGWITVYSEPGYGTKFTIYLPALYNKKVDESIDSLQLECVQGKGETILIVEDEDGVRRFAKKTLSKNGFVVFEAANAQKALSLFERKKGNFDVVVSDVVLPDLNGVQLVGQLVAKKPNLAVILTSGYSDQKSKWDVICEKNLHFLKKPYNTFELLKIIKDAKQASY